MTAEKGVLARLDTVKEAFHTLVAIILVIESLIFVVSFLREQLLPARIATLVGAYLTLLLSSSLGISMALLLVMLLLLRRRSRELRGISTELGHATDDRAELARFIQSYQVCQKAFRVLAHKNARCDKEVFSLLLGTRTGQADAPAAFDAARTRIRLNLDEVLEASREIFSALTGDNCAACVRTLGTAGAAGVEDTLVTIAARDSASQADRSGWLSVYRVGQATEDSAVFVSRHEFYITDDLLREAASGRYQAPMKGWNAHFTALAAARIGALDADDRTADFHALLCIDNMKGGFDNQHARHFLRELAWRLSIILYELRAIDQAQYAGAPIEKTT